MNNLKNLLAALLFVIGSILTSLNHTVYACGFWGDGDVGMINSESDVGIDGRYLSQIDPIVAKGSAETELPGGQGFSFMLRDPTRAIPYTLAVKGEKFHSIGELRAIGITSAVDLISKSSEIHLHREETLATGIQYFSIPIDSFPPRPDQVRQFADIVSDLKNFPIIVYAGNSEILASLWSAYRFFSGVDQRLAVSEGKSLGLGYKHEEELHWHLRNGKLADLGLRLNEPEN